MLAFFLHICEKSITFSADFENENIITMKNFEDINRALAAEKRLFEQIDKICFWCSRV